MRESCLNCVRKHLGNAAVLMHEARFGYPDHMWLAIGHLCQAEVECLAEHPLIALAIYNGRKSYEESDGTYPLPIMELIEQCTIASVKQQNATP